MKNIQLIIFLILTSFIVKSQEFLEQRITDEVDFENSMKIKEYIKLDTNSGNIWRIGKPTKPIFNNAYSENNAIVTDLTKYYPTNIKSSFIMKFFSKYKIPQGINYKIGIDGYYKINSDSLNDYGLIEMSYDNGLHWFNLLDKINHYGYWYYDGNNTMPIFTGNFFEKWHLFSFITNSVYAAAAYDTLWFKFTFISDSINSNKEGWIIDDIVINIYPPDAIDDVVKNNNIIDLYPNPATDKINIDCAIRQNLKMNLYNNVGQCILQRELNTKTNTLDISSLTRGIYIMKLTSPNGTIEKKIIKI